MDYQGVRSASINRHLHDSICVIVWARSKKCQYLMRYIELEISGYQFDDYVFQLSIFLKFQVHAVKITKRKVCPSLISVRPKPGIDIGNQTKVQFRYRYQSRYFFLKLKLFFQIFFSTFPFFLMFSHFLGGNYKFYKLENKPKSSKII